MNVIMIFEFDDGKITYLGGGEEVPAKNPVNSKAILNNSAGPSSIIPISTLQRT